MLATHLLLYTRYSCLIVHISYRDFYPISSLLLFYGPSLPAFFDSHGPALSSFHIFSLLLRSQWLNSFPSTIS